MMKLILTLLLVLFSFQSMASDRCNGLLSNSASVSDEFKSIIDSNQAFKKLSRGGINFSTYAGEDLGFPYHLFPKKTPLVIQEVTHHGWARMRLHRGTLSQAGPQSIVLNINGKGKRIDIDDISGVTLLPSKKEFTEFSSEEMESIRDSNDEFKKHSKDGIIFSIYAGEDTGFPFHQFPKGTWFAIQEVTQPVWGHTRLYKGRLKQAGQNSIVLDINGEGKRIEIDDISGVTIFPE